VVSAFYLGDRQRIVVDVAGANVIADVPVGIALAPGAEFRFAVERFIEIAPAC
jgi:hypothetical protein